MELNAELRAFPVQQVDSYLVLEVA